MNCKLTLLTLVFSVFIMTGCGSSGGDSGGASVQADDDNNNRPFAVIDVDVNGDIPDAEGFVGYGINLQNGTVFDLSGLTSGRYSFESNNGSVEIIPEISIIETQSQLEAFENQYIRSDTNCTVFYSNFGGGLYESEFSDIEVTEKTIILIATVKIGLGTYSIEDALFSNEALKLMDTDIIDFIESRCGQAYVRRTTLGVNLAYFYHYELEETEIDRKEYFKAAVNAKYKDIFWGGDRSADLTAEQHQFAGACKRILFSDNRLGVVVLPVSNHDEYLLRLGEIEDFINTPGNIGRLGALEAEFASYSTLSNSPPAHEERFNEAFQQAFSTLNSVYFQHPPSGGCDYHSEADGLNQTAY